MITKGNIVKKKGQLTRIMLAEKWTTIIEAKGFPSEAIALTIPESRELLADMKGIVSSGTLTNHVALIKMVCDISGCDVNDIYTPLKSENVVHARWTIAIVLIDFLGKKAFEKLSYGIPGLSRSMVHRISNDKKWLNNRRFANVLRKTMAKLSINVLEIKLGKFKDEKILIHADDLQGSL